MSCSISPRRAGAGLILAVSLGAFFSGAARAVTPFDETTITFDDIGAPGNPDIMSLVNGDYLFTSQRFHTIANPSGGTLPLVENGSFFIAEEAGGVGHPITIARSDGLPFALLALDGAEAFLSDVEATLAGFPNAATLEITADVFGGGTTNISLPLDGIKDGLGGVADFQPFTLPQAFCGITSATFSGRTASGAQGAIALDNIRVAAVIPEPATIGFVLAAIVVFCARRRNGVGSLFPASFVVMEALSRKKTPDPLSIGGF
jgi:hypothetical protein